MFFYHFYIVALLFFIISCLFYFLSYVLNCYHF